MANRCVIVVVTILATMVVVGCAADQPTSTAMSTRTLEILPTVTLVTPTASAVPPTDTPSQGFLTVDVPRGDPPTLDGALLPHEWANAGAAAISEASELLFMHDGEYLYLGIRAGEVGVGSICVDQGDKVKVLHSSMALGTAVYEQREGWRVSSRFSWSCSDASDSPQAQAERTEHLETYHWLASNMSMGNPGEMEFQIAMPEGELRLAVTYLQAGGGGGGEEIVWWPADLPHGGCRDANLIQAHEPNVLQFSPENWVVFTP